MSTPLSETSIRVNIPFTRAAEIVDNLLEQVNMRRIMPVDKLSENFYSIEVIVRRGFLRGVKREKITIVKRVSAQANAKVFTYQDVDNKMTLIIRLHKENEDATRVEVSCAAEKHLRDLCSKLTEIATTILSEEAARLTMEARKEKPPAKPSIPPTTAATSSSSSRISSRPLEASITIQRDLENILDDPANLAIRILRAEILYRTNLSGSLDADEIVAQVKKVMENAGAEAVFATLSSGEKTLVIVMTRNGNVYAALHEIDKATRIKHEELREKINEFARIGSPIRLTVYKL